MAEIKTTDKKFMGDFEMELKIGSDPSSVLNLKVKFGEDKAEDKKVVKTFYYYNAEYKTFKLADLYAKVKEIIIPLQNSLPAIPTEEGFLKSLFDAEIGLYELYGDASGQFGINCEVTLKSNPMPTLLNISNLKMKLNLARVFEGAVGIIPGEDGIVLQKLPKDATYNKIEKIVGKDGSFNLIKISDNSLKAISAKV